MAFALHGGCVITFKLDVEDLKKGVDAIFHEVPSEMVDSLDHAKRKFFKTWRAERLRGRPGVKGRRGGIFIRFKSRHARNDAGETRGFFIRSRSQASIIHEFGGMVLHPRSRKPVSVPARLGFYSTWEKMEPVLYNIVAKRVTKSIDKAWDGK